MRRFTAWFVWTTIALTLVGCKKEDPNPELLDPIYVDLDKRYKDADKSLEDEIKKRDDARVAIEKAEANSIELKDARKNLEKSEHAVLEFQQRSLYYKIRSQRRLYVDRITYKTAFAKNEPWPDPHEYSDYQVNIRLHEVPLNWATRVPKLQDRLSKTPSKGEKGGEKTAKAEE